MNEGQKYNYIGENKILRYPGWGRNTEFHGDIVEKHRGRDVYCILYYKTTTATQLLIHS
jgi:hypothetical protein